MKISIFDHKTIQPLKQFGFSSSFWDIHIHTLIFTWIAMAILFSLVLTARFYFKRKKTNPFSYAFEQIIDFFVTLCKDSIGHFSYNYFAFIMALFTFAFICNSAGMLPFIKEPTEDLNTALACGVCSFLYVHYQKIRVGGFVKYIKSYFEPIFILFPLNFVGEFAKIASMSFRLFGNILGGSIIVVIMLKTIEPFRMYFMIYTAIALPLMWLIAKKTNLSNHHIVGPLMTVNNALIFFAAWLMMFFGLFEGIIQAFVITMLTITYLSLVGGDENEEKKENVDKIHLQETVT